MSSPWRISCRARDSSNNAAKFSWGAAGWLVVAVAMSNGCPIALSARHGPDGGSVGHSVVWDSPASGPCDGALFAFRFLHCLLQLFSRGSRPVHLVRLLQQPASL